MLKLRRGCQLKIPLMEEDKIRNYQLQSGSTWLCIANQNRMISTLADRIQVSLTHKMVSGEIPFKMSDDMSRSDVINEYREWIATKPHLVEKAKTELRGKILACWCSPKACHGDVLAQIANE
ncbi:hypothetical protein AKO1_006522 [Acrasis kona]|uniref:DUF4326 domain-containing protein n=1 Tax=Acrasis kona TaxID=1008807 RepID=A0AAW2ZN12_9EUKA